MDWTTIVKFNTYRWKLEISGGCQFHPLGPRIMVRRPQHSTYPEDFVRLGVSWKQRPASVEFGHHGPDGPNIDRGVVRSTMQQNFRCTIPARTESTEIGGELSTIESRRSRCKVAWIGFLSPAQNLRFSTYLLSLEYSLV